jgi:hypothetical protein
MWMQTQYCHVDARPVPIECNSSPFAVVFLQIYLATSSTDGKCRVFSTFIKGVDTRWNTLVLHLLGNLKSSKCFIRLILVFHF